MGFDWDTEFGSLKLNLNGLNAKRTRLLANATSGEEANNWNKATAWLERVESDAAEARLLATRAVDACRKTDWVRALALIEAACAIESSYHSKLRWQSMRDVIRQLVEQPNQAG